MNDYTLLVLAAGMGSRFGGLKQIEPVGPNGEFIIDYSIYDAIRVGFNKVVFVIKKENEQVFKDTIGNRIKDKIKVEYVFQDINELPEGYETPKDRIKPWGTGHALYCARNNINGPFAVINADDLYGPDAYKVVMEFLKTNSNPNHYVSVGYEVENTLSEFGEVKRGINKTENGILKEIIESKVKKEKGQIYAKPLDGRPEFIITSDDTASVNLFGFTPNIIKATVELFPPFLEKNINNLDSEYLMTDDVVSLDAKQNGSVMYVQKTTSKWSGITYKEDKTSLINKINDDVENGIYPKKLWD
ncbi:MAG: nucleotidyltransferase [Bacilli bacterium]|nr:nucleotidyltransferase [Bacilli bacterium]